MRKSRALIEDVDLRALSDSELDSIVGGDPSDIVVGIILAISRSIH